MYSPAKPRVALAPNRSTSLNAIGPNSEPSTISTSISRHSSNELIGSPKNRHTGNFGPVQPRFEISSEMLAVARRSMEVKVSPKVQRALPPLPPLPSHAQVPSPKLTSSHSAISLTTPASLASSASPASPASRSALLGSPTSPVLIHPNSPAPLPPVLTPLSLSKTDSTPEIIPLSPPTKLVARRPLPALPPVPAKPIPALPTIQITHPDLPADSPIPQVSETEQQDPKKDPKYYSNPEPAVTIKDGLCQRHLSAPSSVSSDKLATEIQENSEEVINEPELEKSENSLQVNSNLKLSSEINLGGSGEIKDTGAGARSSVELSEVSSPTTLRSWYLKKNSVQERSAPRIRVEHRTHRKALPDIVEVTQKNKTIKEIFTTEASYVDDLSVALKVFKEPIHKYKTVSDEDIAAMFSNIEELYEVNKALLSSLVELIPTVNELAADEAPCPPIGDVFLRHLNKFSAYTTYLCNKDLSTRVVKKVENLAHFSALMHECRHNRECQGLGLADFLIKPVQRLCKYPLLFKELRKYLVSDDPQLPTLNEVITEIERIAEITNKTITNTEKLGEVKKIMGHEISPLLEGATMIRDGTMFVVVKSKKEESFFWLLDSVILWHPMKATLRKVVKSSKSKNTLLISSIASVSEEEYERHKHSFSLKFKNSAGKEKRVVFCAQSYLEKLCWLDDIKSQLAK